MRFRQDGRIGRVCKSLWEMVKSGNDENWVFFFDSNVYANRRTYTRSVMRHWSSS